MKKGIEMERMLNCDNDVLLDMIHDEPWYEVIKSRNHVRISGEKPIEIGSFVKDEPKDEWELLERDGVNVYPHSDFVKETQKYPGMTLQHPSDIYICPDDKAIAERTRKSFGTCVFSNSAYSVKPLIRNWNKTVVPDVPHSWKQFLEKFHVGNIPPSNSLIII